MPQHIERALLEIQARALECGQQSLDMPNVAMHTGRLAKQYVHRHVNDGRAVGALDHQLAIVARYARSPRKDIVRAAPANRKPWSRSGAIANA